MEVDYDRCESVEFPLLLGLVVEVDLLLVGEVLVLVVGVVLLEVEGLLLLLVQLKWWRGVVTWSWMSGWNWE